MPTSRHLWRAGLLAMVLLAVIAGPAAADPPIPTNYQARVLELTPPVDGVDARVLGGDSFLQLIVAPGREVVVPGYDGRELYLRFDANGEVYENRLAVAYYQNQDRFRTTAAERPAQVGADVPPDWVLVSTDGTFAWHDHRVHWMAPGTLPFLDTGDPDAPARPIDPNATEVQRTTYWAEPIPIRVDGEEVGIVGELLYLPNASPIPALLSMAGVLLVGLIVGRRDARTGILVSIGLGAVPALAASIPLVVGLPPGVDVQPLQPLLPVVAVVVALAGIAARERSPMALAVAGAGGVPLIGWVGANIGAINAPIIPPEAVPNLAGRIAVGMAIGGGLAALATGIRDLFASNIIDDDRAEDPSDEPATTV
jgi:hypothetical protein